MKAFVKINHRMEQRLNIFEFSDYSPPELAEITNHALISHDLRYPYNVLDLFNQCFLAILKHIRSQWNGGLRKSLIEAIFDAQVFRLDINCSSQEVDKVKEAHVKNGIEKFMKSKVSAEVTIDKEVQYSVEMVDKSVQYPPEVSFDLENIGHIFASP